MVLVLSIDVPGVIHMHCFSVGSYTFLVSEVIGRNQGVGMPLCWESPRHINEEDNICARPQSSINFQILNGSLLSVSSIPDPLSPPPS